MTFVIFDGNINELSKRFDTASYLLGRLCIGTGDQPFEHLWQTNVLLKTDWLNIFFEQFHAYFFYLILIVHPSQS